jgi:hypothetical protein
MKKTYNVIIGNDSFQITAFNMAEARQSAQFLKGRMGLKGSTRVVCLNKSKICIVK